jgi:hypothetical protein
MLDWVIHQIGVGVLIVIFALAVWHKLRHYPRFRAAVAAYDMVPEAFVAWFAALIVLLELLTVAFLAIHEGRGTLLAFALFGTYTLAMGLNMARGRAEIDCGCGDLPIPLSRWLLLRNVVLMGLALLAARHPDAEGSPGGWVLVGAGIILATGLYLIIEQLLANLPYVRGRYG